MRPAAGLLASGARAADNRGMFAPRHGRFAILIGVLLAAGCGGERVSERSGTATPAAGSMTAVEARAYLAEHPDALILDVRNPSEWDDDLGHIEGARLIPLPELTGRMAELEPWKGKPIVAVCRVGARSATAANDLAQAGYTPVFNLAGGMVAWRSAGF
jgi:rhodanese-related sulfurtransferase